MTELQGIQKQARIRYILAFIFAVVCLALLIFASWRMYTVFMTFKMFPEKWGQWLLTGLAGLCFFLGIFVLLPNIKTMGKLIWGVLCLIFTVILLFGSVYLPSIRSRIEIMFTDVPTEGELEVAFFERADTEHEIDPNTGEAVIHIEDYKDKTFMILPGLDKENEDYALLFVSKAMDIEKDAIRTLPMNDLWEAIEAFYNGTADVLVINASYIPVIKNVTEYANFEQQTRRVYSVKQKIQLINKNTKENITKEPFTVYIGGNDQNGEISLEGRTDVNLIVTVNPVTKQVLIGTMPRDSWVPNPAVAHLRDKLTHMGIYGIQNTINALQEIYDTDIDYFIMLNFDTFMTIIDRIGGVTINNPYGFKANSIKEYHGYFEEGEITLSTGGMALAYVRERYNLPGGDFDRNMHQQIVLKALIEKLTSLEMVTKFDQILAALQGQFATTLSMDEIYAICQMQLDDLAKWNITTYSVQGGFGWETCASTGSSLELSVVYPNQDQIDTLKRMIVDVKEGRVPSKE